MSDIRVRIAPSPSGYLHVGTARTAIFNYLYAKAKGGKFILRIEDTDQARSSEDMVAVILEGLQWLAVDWDEGPYYQSQRFDHYPPYTEKLLESGAAYRCFCTSQELAEKRDRAQKEKKTYQYDRKCRDLSDDQIKARLDDGNKFTVRLKLPLEGEVSFEDQVLGRVSKAYADLDDFIIVRSDGSPIYNFAVVADDIEMGISHVIRGNDHIANTYKQVEIYKALNAQLPQFAHIPLLLRPDRSKVSKRKGDKSVTEYRDEGILPEAMFNFLALLGWSPKDDREIMSREEIIKTFDFKGINPNNAVFDPVKLTWMNSQYIMKMDNHTLVERIQPILMEKDLATKYWIETRWQWMLKVVEQLKERCENLYDFAEKGYYFFKDDFEYDPKGVKKRFAKEGVAEKLKKLREEFGKHQDLTKSVAEQAIRGLAESMEVGAGQLIHPTRLALTGMTGGPGLFDIIELINQPEVDKRLSRAIEFIRSL
ncbi:MAG: glutamate--tRNA ligase [candidate division Zixibacteria bacterium]|nr:glutamate--tRNA ligase [candidate division Zixibacteria bacterium]